MWIFGAGSGLSLLETQFGLLLSVFYALIGLFGFYEPSLTYRVWVVSENNFNSIKMNRLDLIMVPKKILQGKKVIGQETYETTFRKSRNKGEPLNMKIYYKLYVG